MNRLGKLRSGIVVGIALMLMFQGAANAQRPRQSSSARAEATGLLDRFIVARYRGAQLLADSSAGVQSVIDAPLPRVEYVQDTRGDTLVGIHFTASAVPPSLQVGRIARLAVPTGAITNVEGRVVARRLFRAPRIPNAPTDSADAWRYGWAYVVTLPRRRDALPAKATRGWLLVDSARAAAGSPRDGTR